MQLEKLFLKKEELPILYKNCFQIPIHPKLLNSDISIREEIAHEIFPEVAEEWYKELSEYAETTDDKEESNWIKEAFLKEKPEITKQFNSQYLMGYWEDIVQTDDNGFVCSFSINRNAGGTIYFNREDDMLCKTILPHRMIRFSDEKSKEFEARKVGDYSVGFVYAPHNVDFFPGALFLRNWAIKYMNEVFKENFK